jgi:hypothetical protein
MVVFPASIHAEYVPIEVAVAASILGLDESLTVD